MFFYTLFFLFCAFGSYLATKLSLKIALKINLLDKASSNPERKKQFKPVALSGSTGFILVASFCTTLAWYFRDFFYINFGIELGLNIENFNLAWILLSILILLLAGIADDFFQFKSKVMLIPSTLALLIAVYLGDLRIQSWSYPFDQLIPDIAFLHSFLAFLWIGLCLSATKFLDGHDGLVGSVGIINLSSIIYIALLPNVNQPFIVLLALIWMAGILGFLPFNLPDAKVYLGEAGSQVIGFIIGILSILGGAKVATASAVIGWFIFDFIFVIFLRIKAGYHPLKGDRRHWHFRLYDLGLTKYQVLGVTLTLIGLTATLGVLLPTVLKPWLLISQGLILLLIFIYTEWLVKKTK